MYQEAIKYALKVWGASTAVVLTFLIFLNINQESGIMFHVLKNYFTETGILSLIGFVIVVLWFRFKFYGEVFIKKLLTGMFVTFLAMVLYVHYASSIGQPIMILFLIAMIIGIWFFKLPMHKTVVDKKDGMEDILDA